MNENTTPDTEVQNIEMTAGEMLRNARTTGRRKREIPTVAKQLCIREEFLQALEDGDYSVIPETVYILGFARNYAMELGLNPDEIVAKIKREMGISMDGVADTDSGDGNAGAASGVQKDRKIMGRIIAFVRRKWILVGGLAAVLLVLVVGLVAFSAANRASNMLPDNGVAPTAEVQMVAEPDYSKPVREQFGKENRGKADVILQAVQDGWVKIEDARGNTVFSRVLVAGDVYYVPSGDGYKATFGNAGGVDIWADGALMEKAGPAHTRKADISLSPDKLKPAAPAPAADEE